MILPPVARNGVALPSMALTTCSGSNMKLMPWRREEENGLKLRTKVGLPASPPYRIWLLVLAASVPLEPLLPPHAATPIMVATASVAAAIRLIVLLRILLSFRLR